MKIALFGRPFRKGFEDNISSLFKWLENQRAEVIIFESFYNFLSAELGLKPKIHGTYITNEDIIGNADFMLSIGGDGTFLESVTIVQDYGIPIIGINTGRLGFLANISPERIESSLDAIAKGDFEVERRTLASLSLSQGKLKGFSCALNEVSIQKKYSTMITIHAYLNGVLLNSYWADGLVISTPTGSTAYSLSLGGPIVTPDSGNFIISPMAPHTLTIRPVIVPDHNVIKLRVDSSDSSFILTLDSRSEIFGTDLEISIKRADFTIKTIRIEGNTFYDNLRNKLLWGQDKRN
ncbi:MAG: NAD kinase [Bacteroidales bacterium]|nr:NAD kinase [Bacteroidales bacterium]